MSIQSPQDRDEDKIEDISDITDQAIFQGAISLLNKGIIKSTKQPLKQQQLPSHSPHNDKREEQSKTKILQNLTKMDQPSQGASNSMYSSGILSFRNKKAYFQNPQFSQGTSQKIEESADPEAITQSILEKMNIKKSNKHYYSQKDKGKTFNNESTKAYEEEYEERDFKAENTISSEGNCNSEGNDNDEGEESNRIFWQVKKDKEGEALTKAQEHHHSLLTSGTKRKHKYLKKIVCTLSLLEKGKAIFVSQDDMIFVLPALFVPKNLCVGNTYVFKVRDYEPFSFKSNLIQDIQKKYET